MILDLNGIAEFPVRVRLEADPAAVQPFTPDVVEVLAVLADLAVQKGTGEYFCQARTTARVRLECARCLAPYEAELRGTADFILRPESPPGQADPFDDEEYLFFRGNDLRVDVFEPVRQSLILEVPMLPLCDENCRGLCPQCGTNLNVSACTCARRQIDPRWEGLRGLFR